MRNKQIAEAISKHQFEKAYEYFASDITWNLVGGHIIKGKDAIRKTCEESARYLSKVKTDFLSFTAYESQDTVIIESSARYIEVNGETSAVASCDIYTFHRSTLKAITSYNIELPKITE